MSSERGDPTVDAVARCRRLNRAGTGAPVLGSDPPFARHLGSDSPFQEVPDTGER
jgi:hypothetical protein